MVNLSGPPAQSLRLELSAARTPSRMSLIQSMLSNFRQVTGSAVAATSESRLGIGFQGGYEPAGELNGLSQAS
jgi:hypothetical protein